MSHLQAIFWGMIPGYLTSADIAERLGVKIETVRQYKLRGDLPPPDDYVGRSPVWKDETIQAWERERPGLDWRKGRSKEQTSD